jgi:hypothetical protein
MKASSGIFGVRRADAELARAPEAEAGVVARVPENEHERLAAFVRAV